MTIRIEKISKKYGNQTVLNSFSLNINKGEIIGLLGPNGAGKSTLMKILVGILLPDSGNVYQDEHLVDVESIGYRSKMGFLPEDNPLYTELYVEEYLRLIAGMYQLKEVKSKVDEVLQLTGLYNEKGKKISALSKGYKQRVGLAQAIIHNPDILILDEPTSGLDPNQIVEIRELIRDLSKDKTVILSTHLMQEVEAVCDRIVILNKGEKVAEGKPDSLQDQHVQRVYVEYEKSPERTLFDQLDEVECSEETDGYLFSSEKGDIRADLFRHAVMNDLVILKMVEQSQNLEELFKRVTDNA